MCCCFAGSEVSSILDSELCEQGLVGGKTVTFVQ